MSIDQSGGPTSGGRLRPSSRPVRAAAASGTPEAPNVLHTESDGRSTWSTTNLAESIPGVSTPLSWSIWGPAGEQAVRRTFHAIGALSRAEAGQPTRPEDALLGVFYGRAALRVDLVCAWVERVPGQDPAAAAMDAFAAVPEGYQSRSQPRYYPRVAARALTPFVKAPRLIAAHRPIAEAFRNQALAALPHASPAAARKWLADAVWHWNEGLFRNTLITMGTIQPLVDRLEDLGERAGVPGQELMAGYGGHEETQVVTDAWACSRGRLSKAEFIARHGYHGWHEGELSSIVWREDPAPVDALIERYAARAEDGDPALGERARVVRRHELERAFLDGLPRSQRGIGKLVLKGCARYVPLRGVGKVTFLLALDAARAAARRLSDQLELDAFYLTFAELQGELPADAVARVQERRALRERYAALDIPGVFCGVPEPVTVAAGDDAVLEGIAASPGVVEGPVRVILDPTDADIEEGEILVGRTTDPSWASLMFLSAGLIADIGGLLSHTAVVARELGLPCVVDAKVATSRLKTGDRVRLDGTNGTIEIL